MWQRVFVKSKMDWQMRIHQAAELLKILSLVGIIVTQISYNRWSAETIYNFAWLHVLIVVVTLILLIVETTNEFFHSEEKVDKGDAKDSSDY